VQTKNENLNNMHEDMMYHLGLTKESAQAFAGVKYVCIGRSAERMQKFAIEIGTRFGF
jgi:hypothetical protein